jgi:hypothetical protein
MMDAKSFQQAATMFGRIVEFKNSEERESIQRQLLARPQGVDSNVYEIAMLEVVERDINDKNAVEGNAPLYQVELAHTQLVGISKLGIEFEDFERAQTDYWQSPNMPQGTLTFYPGWLAIK